MVECFRGGDQILRSIKWYKSLSDQKKRIEEGFFLVEGIRAVTQIATIAGSLDEVLVTENPAGTVPSFGCPVRELTGSQFLSVSSSRTPQGIIGVAKLPMETYSPDLPSKAGSRILLLENIQDPGNVGTLIRTAAAMDFSGIVMSLQSADPFSPKVVQASAGALLSLWLRRNSAYMNMVLGLKESGYRLFSADVKGESLMEFSEVQNIIIALGNEGSGLTEDLIKLSDRCFRIPFNSRRVESLNVAVSGAIAMFCVSASKDHNLSGQ